MGTYAERLTLTEILHGLRAAERDDPSLGDAEAASWQSRSDTVVHAQVPESDVPIVQRINRSDERALEQLYTNYYGSLHAIAAAMTCGSAEADEVVDDVFDALWSIRETWMPVYGIWAYLVRAVRNRARNVLRAERRRTRVEQAAVVRSVPGEMPAMGAPEAAVGEQLDAEALAQVVWSVIAGLSESAQLILTLRWRHGLSWNAIAHAMDLSAGAVQMQHNRACKLLRQRLPRHLR